MGSDATIMATETTSITFLGTASVIPEVGHDTASFVINNGKYLVDTGWYAASRMRAYGFDPLKLEYLFLTHCHHDHYIGLPQIMFYLAMRHYKETNYPPIKIIGPREDLERVVNLAREFLQQGDRFPEAGCPVELIPLSAGETYEDPAFQVETCKSLHPVPALCYRFTDKKTGATFAFTGDTAYDPSIAEHVRGVQLLITEASYGANPAPESNASLHSGAPDAARMAVEAGVDRLALMHCAAQNQAAALAAAQAIFPNTVWPADGETIVVE